MIEPTPALILVAVKALLKSEAPHAAILAMIAELEAIGERERQEAQYRHDVLLRDMGLVPTVSRDSP